MIGRESYRDSAHRMHIIVQREKAKKGATFLPPLAPLGSAFVDTFDDPVVYFLLDVADSIRPELHPFRELPCVF